MKRNRRTRARYADKVRPISLWKCRLISPGLPWERRAISARDISGCSLTKHRDRRVSACPTVRTARNEWASRHKSPTARSLTTMSPCRAGNRQRAARSASCSGESRNRTGPRWVAARSAPRTRSESSGVSPITNRSKSSEADRSSWSCPGAQHSRSPTATSAAWAPKPKQPRPAVTRFSSGSA